MADLTPETALAMAHALWVTHLVETKATRVPTLAGWKAMGVGAREVWTSRADMLATALGSLGFEVRKIETDPESRALMLRPDQECR